MRVFFWQNFASHIQAPALRSFASIWDDEVHGVWAAPISEDRKALGWKHPDFGQLIEHQIEQDNDAKLTSLVIENPEAIHIFSGLGAYAPIDRALKHAISLDAPHLGLMVEPAIQMGWKGLLRPLKTRLLARSLTQKLDLILAMGQAGTDYYRRCGFRNETVFPFMYQCETQSEKSSQDASSPVRLVYVGKFIPRKGFDILLEGMFQTQQRNWILDVIGDGPERQHFEQRVAEQGLQDQIRFRGVVTSAQILRELSNYDVALIPSRFEGWGVVVNEAITTGLATICSDRVTSRELVTSSQSGWVYSGDSCHELATIVDKIVVSPEMIAEAKVRAQSFSDRISGAAVASYLEEVLRFQFSGEGSSRPHPPWLKQIETTSVA